MARIVLIGTGNVAKHLFTALTLKKGVGVVQVVGRHARALEYFKPHVKTGTPDGVDPGADIYIIAVSDDAISTVSQQLGLRDKLVVHTSGSMPMDVLRGRDKRGVFYPLQSMSANRRVDYRSMPVCIEAEDDVQLAALYELAAGITDSVYRVSSRQRASLHLSAVFANNFTNHMYHIANTLLERHQLPFEILHPLIRETAEKVLAIDPYEAQTGPARRNDSNSMEIHRGLLNTPTQREIYDLLSESIRNTYAG